MKLCDVMTPFALCSSLTTLSSSVAIFVNLLSIAVSRFSVVSSILSSRFKTSSSFLTISSILADLFVHIVVFSLLFIWFVLIIFSRWSKSCPPSLTQSTKVYVTCMAPYGLFGPTSLYGPKFWPSIKNSIMSLHCNDLLLYEVWDRYHIWFKSYYVMKFVVELAKMGVCDLF